MTRLTARTFTLRRAFQVAGLVLAWCALWGSLSAANVLTGVVVGVVALTVGMGESRLGGIQFLPLMRFTWLVWVDLIASTATVVREVLTPTDHTDEGIIAVAIPPGCRRHLLPLFVAITVTPGTAVVAAEADASVLYVHLLYSDGRDEVTSHVQRLARLLNAALPDRAPQRGVPS